MSNWTPAQATDVEIHGPGAPVVPSYVVPYSAPPSPVERRFFVIDTGGDAVTLSMSTGVLTVASSAVRRYLFSSANAYRYVRFTPLYDPTDTTTMAYGYSLNGDSDVHDASRLSRNEGLSADNLAPWRGFRDGPFVDAFAEPITSIGLIVVDNGGTQSTTDAIQIEVW